MISSRGYGNVEGDTMSKRGIILSLGHSNDLSNKIMAIKALRELTGYGLKEAKDAVEGVRPGHMTSFFPTYDILRPQLDDITKRLGDAGFTVQQVDENNEVRKAIGEEVRKLATYATLGGQYDLAKGLIDIADAHCLGADPDFDIHKALGEDNG